MRAFQVLIFLLSTVFPLTGTSTPAISTESQQRYQKIIDAFETDSARYTERWRPQLAFSAILGYMNDPNGLVYFNGKWHLMYQHWKLGFIDGCNWGHAVSEDLVHWKHFPPALAKDEKGDIWSGSAVVDRNNDSGFFSTGEEGLVAFFTYKAADGYQSVGLAYSSDGMQWRKYEGNPVLGPIKNVPGEDEQPGFRDPKVFWHEQTKRWIMVLGADKFRIYSSTNLKDWKLESVENFVTECPDLFELPVLDAEGNPTDKSKWVLSLASVYYRLGTFDGERFKNETGNIAFSHKSNLYAAQSFSDAPNGRRILIHWHNGYDQEKLGTPWGCALSIPAELSLRQGTDQTIYLAQTPVEEIKRLRQECMQWKEMAFQGPKGALAQVRAVPVEIEITIDPRLSKRAGAIVRAGKNGEQTRVGYNAEKKELFIDRSQSGMTELAGYSKFLTAAMLPDKDGLIRLRIFADESLIDVFSADGKQRLSGWIFPSPASDGIDLFADGGQAVFKSVKIYPLASPWRKTPPANGKAQKIQLGRSFYKIKAGQSITLSAAAISRSANPVPIQWKVSGDNPESLRILDDTTTVFTPQKSGIVTITASHENLSDACRIAAYEPSLLSNIKNWNADDENAWLEVANGLRAQAKIPGKRTHYNALEPMPEKAAIETDLTLEKGARGGMFFRDNGRHKVCYQLYFDADSGKLELFRQLDWRKSSRIAQAAIDPKPGKTVRLRVECKDGKIAVFADNAPVFEAADTGIPNDFRRFSLFVHTGCAIFQNVKIPPIP